MLEFLGGRMGSRKARLFAVACFRHDWPAWSDPRERAAILAAERLADGALAKADGEAVAAGLRGRGHPRPLPGRGPPRAGLLGGGSGPGQGVKQFGRGRASGGIFFCPTPLLPRPASLRATTSAAAARVTGRANVRPWPAAAL